MSNILEQLLGNQTGLVNVENKKLAYQYDYQTTNTNTMTTSETYSPTITYSPNIVVNSPNANTTSRPDISTDVEPRTVPVIKLIPTASQTATQKSSSAGMSGIIGSVMPYVVIGGILYYLLK